MEIKQQKRLVIQQIMRYSSFMYEKNSIYVPVFDVLNKIPENNKP